MSGRKIFCIVLVLVFSLGISAFPRSAAAQVGGGTGFAIQGGLALRTWLQHVMESLQGVSPLAEPSWLKNGFPRYDEGDEGSGACPHGHHPRSWNGDEGSGACPHGGHPG